MPGKPKNRPKFVDIETPYYAESLEDLIRNIRYARACVHDSLQRGEIPYASHLFFTQPGILDDSIAEERELGINAGKEIVRALGAITVVYTDLGISEGMRQGIKLAKEEGRRIEYRRLGSSWEKVFLRRESAHSHKLAWLCVD